MAGKTNPTPPFPNSDHNHASCVTEALSRAEALCAQRGARLTKTRRRVFELIWASHAPIRAYDLLRDLSLERERTTPPTIYRALDFLLEQGLIHRIESLNAYVGCGCPADDHAGQFLICDACGTAAELQDRRILEAITEGADQAGFSVARSTVEVRGLCPDCRSATADRGPAPHG